MKLITKCNLVSALFGLVAFISTAQEAHHNAVRIKKKTDIAPIELTPNGDGVNDVFNFSGRNLMGIRAEILDEKGKIIYQCGRTGGKWNGKTKTGENAKAGIYYFKMIAEDGNRQLYERKGTIKLKW